MRKAIFLLLSIGCLYKTGVAPGATYQDIAIQESYGHAHCLIRSQKKKRKLHGYFIGGVKGATRVLPGRAGVLRDTTTYIRRDYNVEYYCAVTFREPIADEMVAICYVEAYVTRRSPLSNVRGPGKL